LTRIMRGTSALILLLLPLAMLVPAGAQTRQVPADREMIHLSFAPVVKQVAPAVVNVYSRRTIETRPQIFDDPIFRRFFGDQTPLGLPRERVQQSLGSGVLLDPNGLIVTNRHVIEGAQEITVVLADRREFAAKILVADQRTDLAVLKIDAHGEKLPVLDLGDSDKLEVGDLVLAIGNPFGVGQTVTSGIVSALARTAIGASDYRSFIQTDAAINPGNSGGALVDLDGKLVGINSAIYSRSGGSIGIGFAIPTVLVRSVLQAATSGGQVQRPWLGASGQAVTSEIAAGLGLPRPVGVLVKEVAPASPAAEAGLRSGDVILEVDGHEVEDPEGLRFRVATLAPNASAQLTLWRTGQRRIVTAVLVPPPEIPPRQVTDLIGREPLSGATVANLNPAFAEEIGFETTTHGVVVTVVRGNSPAARLGLKPADIIASLNRHPIDSVEQLKQQLASNPASWIIGVRRGGELITVNVQ
jgi:Do/DeqQ family serine protease